MDRQYRMLVDGELVNGVMAFDVVNPATAEAFAKCPKADELLIDRAVVAAKRAFPAWAAKPLEERGCR